MALSVKLTNVNFRVGVGTVGTSPLKLTATPFDVLKSVYIKCTAGTIYVGVNSGVSAAIGYPLVAAGDNVVEVAVDDASKIWIVGAAGGQTYKWLAS